MAPGFGSTDGERGSGAGFGNTMSRASTNYLDKPVPGYGVPLRKVLKDGARFLDEENESRPRCLYTDRQCDYRVAEDTCVALEGYCQLNDKAGLIKWNTK